MARKPKKTYKVVVGGKIGDGKSVTGKLQVGAIFKPDADTSEADIKALLERGYIK